MELKTKEIENILITPSSFTDLKKLSDNIIAYSQLEYMEGYLMGIFGKMIREIMDIIDDYDIYKECIKDLDEFSKSLENKFHDNKAVKNITLYLKCTLLHNINKKKGKYNLS